MEGRDARGRASRDAMLSSPCCRHGDSAAVGERGAEAETNWLVPVPGTMIPRGSISISYGMN